MVPPTTISLESPSSISDSPSSPVFSPMESSVDSVTSAEDVTGTPVRRRYPAHLSRGSPRKPNTSQYETMEDLLTAAGYSVTRVFTPETERIQKAEPSGGIGTMVAGWFANMLPAASIRARLRSSAPTPTPDPVEDAGANPFLQEASRATRSLRTQLMTRALKPHSSRARQDPQALRHTSSAPSLPRAVSGRRRGLPMAWRELDAPKAWSGGFVAKPETHPTRGWFGSTRSLDSQQLGQPTVHRVRSAPRIHVPAPAPPVQPTPVVQPSVVVCRSISRASSPPKSGKDPEHDAQLCLAPEPSLPDGLPPTPCRPVLPKQHSNGFLRRPRPQVVVPLDDDEPDLASIINAFRPPSEPTSPTRRQRSIRSLRALLKDPKFPDVPVVCVASPATVSAGGPGRALWMRGDA